MKIPNNDLKANLTARLLLWFKIVQTDSRRFFFESDGLAVRTRITNCEGVLVPFFEDGSYAIL